MTPETSSSVISALLAIGAVGMAGLTGNNPTAYGADLAHLAAGNNDAREQNREFLVDLEQSGFDVFYPQGGTIDKFLADGNTEPLGMEAKFQKGLIIRIAFYPTGRDNDQYSAAFAVFDDKALMQAVPGETDELCEQALINSVKNLIELFEKIGELEGGTFGNVLELAQSKYPVR